jgi:hypothetical protein
VSDEKTDLSSAWSDADLACTTASEIERSYARMHAHDSHLSASHHQVMMCHFSCRQDEPGRTLRGELRSNGTHDRGFLLQLSAQCAEHEDQIASKERVQFVVFIAAPCQRVETRERAVSRCIIVVLSVHPASLWHPATSERSLSRRCLEDRGSDSPLARSSTAIRIDIRIMRNSF